MEYVCVGIRLEQIVVLSLSACMVSHSQNVDSTGNGGLHPAPSPRTERETTTPFFTVSHPIIILRQERSAAPLYAHAHAHPWSDVLLDNDGTDRVPPLFIQPICYWLQTSVLEPAQRRMTKLNPQKINY